MRHTKAPWNTEKGTGIIWGELSTGIIIAAMPDKAKYPRSADEWEANATFIVQTVNAHDKLVEALKYAREIIDDQVKLFHKDCRCQLCESAPMVINEALNLAGAL